MRRSGKIPVLSLAPGALPFLLSADETKKDIRDKGTMAAGAASNLNEVSPSKEHPSPSSEEPCAPFRSALRGRTKNPALNPRQRPPRAAEMSGSVLPGFKAPVAQEVFAVALLLENSPGQKPLLGEKGGLGAVSFCWFWTHLSND